MITWKYSISWNFRSYSGIDIAFVRSEGDKRSREALISNVRSVSCTFAEIYMRCCRHEMQTKNTTSFYGRFDRCESGYRFNLVRHNYRYVLICFSLTSRYRCAMRESRSRIRLGAKCKAISLKLKQPARPTHLEGEKTRMEKCILHARRYGSTIVIGRARGVSWTIQRSRRCLCTCLYRQDKQEFPARVRIV